jgi:hypothetical protein
MVKGYEIHFRDEAGKLHICKVGIADTDKALSAAIGNRNASDVFILPLKDGEYEALGLTEGQVLESALLN